MKRKVFVDKKLVFCGQEHFEIKKYVKCITDIEDIGRNIYIENKI